MIFSDDTLSIKCKKPAAAAIIERYACFGWKLEEENDDKFYGDVAYLTFSRPHFIENKDKLQLLQVRLEIAINKIGKLASKPASHSAIASVIFGLFSAAFFACGIAVIILSSYVLPLLCGALFCAYATGLIAYSVFYSKKIYRQDKQKYDILIENQRQKILEISSQASALCAQSGGDK